MSEKPDFEVALFDIGGVFSFSGPSSEEIAQLLGVDQLPGGIDRTDQAIWAHRYPYDLGGSDTEYWTKVAQDAGQPDPDPALIDQLAWADANRWRPENMDPEVIELAFQFRQAGKRVAILSNAPSRLAGVFRRQAWVNAVAEQLFFSSDLHCAKPEAEIFTKVCAALQVASEQVAFFDDQPRNIEGARRCGLHGVLWEDVTSGQAWL